MSILRKAYVIVSHFSDTCFLVLRALDFKRVWAHAHPSLPKKIVLKLM